MNVEKNKIKITIFSHNIRLLFMRCGLVCICLKCFNVFHIKKKYYLTLIVVFYEYKENKNKRNSSNKDLFSFLV